LQELFNFAIGEEVSPAPTPGLVYHYEIETWSTAYTSCDNLYRMQSFDGSNSQYYPTEYSECFFSCDNDPYCNFAALADVEELKDVTSVLDANGDACSNYQAEWCGVHDDSDFSSNDYCAVCGGGVQYAVSDCRVICAYMWMRCRDPK
jgi:hypothetical protein